MQGGSKRPDLASAEPRPAAGDLGTVVPLRAQAHIAATSVQSDLSNVIPFARRGRKPTLTNAPAIEVAAGDRPAPQIHSTDRQRRIAVLVGGSLLIHGVLFAAFNNEPEPHASIGMISITAEIVLGAQTNAGRSTTPTENDTESPETPTRDEPIDMRSETARKQIEAAVPKIDEALPVEKPPESKSPAELAVQTNPAQKPTLTPAPEKKEAPVNKERKKNREVARHAKDDGEDARDRAAPSAPSSNSVGRGQSNSDANYRGIVAAHLARFKQFPADARSRGDQGVVTVTFGLSGGGSVTSARLVKGSGISSIDQEATAMVRRASPFPAPPSGRAMSFTVPVSFHLR